MDFIVLENDEKQIIQLRDKKDLKLLITFRMNNFVRSQTRDLMTERYGWTGNDTMRFKRGEGKEILRQLFDNMRERRKCLRR